MQKEREINLAGLTSKLARVRKDFLDKLSSRLIKENQIISLEDLNVSGMLSNRKLARAISQQGWSMFRAMCEAKANKYGRDVRIISRWQPTSQICADCGYQWGKLDLSIREIICLGCGKVECRDSNASRSIDRIGLGHSHDGYKWAGSGHKTSAEAIHDELSTRKLEWEQLALPI